MLNLKTTDLLRVSVATAGADIRGHASWSDLSGGTVTASGGAFTPITTASTQVVVAAPGAGVRNVRSLYIKNHSATVSTAVGVHVYDGASAAELVKFTLLPGETLTFGEEGTWVHRAANGGEYQAPGNGEYDGYSVGFMKTSTVADAVGYWYCTSKDAGFPGAWAPGSPGLNGRSTDGTTTDDAGCIPIKNAASGGNYLTDVSLAASVGHSNLFFDVLWVNSGIVLTTTTAQSITMGALPARDVNGSSNGKGLMIGILCTAAVGLAAVSSTATVNYTNSAGVAGRTATLSAAIGSQAPATPVIGTVIWFNLQAGDDGVRSIEGITLNTSWVSGSISLFIARRIASIGAPIVNITAQKTISNPGIRLHNGVCLLHAILASAVTATFFTGDLTIQEK